MEDIQKILFDIFVGHFYFKKIDFDDEREKNNQKKNLFTFSKLALFPDIMYQCLTLYSHSCNSHLK